MKNFIKSSWMVCVRQERFRSSSMNLTNKFRLRVKTCIGTIIDVHKRITSPYGSEEFLSHFENLKKTINDLDMNRVSEREVLIVEQATNALLGEFRPMFETGEYGPVYQQLKH